MTVCAFFFLTTARRRRLIRDIMSLVFGRFVHFEILGWKDMFKEVEQKVFDHLGMTSYTSEGEINGLEVLFTVRP
eukprot:SAG11_NODE_18957_length_477_cov_1.066138_2_plen_74_part_01